MNLSRESILASNPVTTAPVDVPEWGGRVYVRTLSGSERDAFDARLMPDKSGKRNFANFRGWFVALVASKENGERLFQDADAVALGKQPARVLDRVVDAALKHNAMQGDASVEEALGNSEAGPSAGSGSVSP